MLRLLLAYSLFMTAALAGAADEDEVKTTMDEYFTSMKRGDFEWQGDRLSKEGQRQIYSLMNALARFADEAGEFDEVKQMFGPNINSVAEVKKLTGAQLYAAMIRLSVPKEEGWKQVMSVTRFRLIGSLPDGADTRYAIYIMSLPSPDGGDRIDKASMLRLQREDNEWRLGMNADLERTLKPVLESFRKKRDAKVNPPKD